MTRKPFETEEEHWRDTPPDELGRELADKHLDAIRAVVPKNAQTPAQITVSAEKIRRLDERLTALEARVAKLEQKIAAPTMPAPIVCPNCYSQDFQKVFIGTPRYQCNRCYYDWPAPEDD